ncbi:MAG: hypothetical protein WA137_10625 [Methanothrix sp.]
MNKKFVALLLLPAMLIVASICLAQSDHDQEQAWLPPSWVFGSGYTPYDYPSSVGSWGYDPFTYYSHQGKTYHPYRYSYIGSAWYPSYYQYNYDYYYPYTYRYYWYPYTYHNGYWWS